MYRKTIPRFHNGFLFLQNKQYGWYKLDDTTIVPIKNYNMLTKLFFVITILVATIATGIAQEINPKNAKNEFDDIGKIHTDLLSKIVFNPKEAEQFIANPKEYCFQLLDTNDIDISAYGKALHNKKVEEIMGPFIPNYVTINKQQIDFYYEVKLISLPIKQAAEQLLALTERLEKKQQFATLQKEILALEDKAIRMNENENNFVLCMCALVRHTLHYALKQSQFSIEKIKQLTRATLAGAFMGGIRTAMVSFYDGPIHWEAWAAAILGTSLSTAAIVGLKTDE
jgi:hypothetical protein